MTVEDPASPARNRLTKERPEVALARDVARADLMMGQARRGAADHPEEAASLFEDLAEELRRLWDRFTGRSQSAPGAESSHAPQAQHAPEPPFAPAAGYGPPAGPGPHAGPRQPSAGELTAQREMAGLEKKIDRLGPESRMAFEDAMLRLVRNDATLKAAFERSPQSIPTIAKYAVNAHLRESLREAPSAETAMSRARDTIMARDAQQMTELQNRWQRQSGTRGDGEGRTRSQAPEAEHLLSPEGRELLRRQVDESRTSPRRTPVGGNGAAPTPTVPLHRANASTPRRS
ncbi:hypothetical protein [Streptomyces sp. NPDC003832]